MTIPGFPGAVIGSPKWVEADRPDPPRRGRAYLRGRRIARRLALTALMLLGSGWALMILVGVVHRWNTTLATLGFGQAVLLAGLARLVTLWPRPRRPVDPDLLRYLAPVRRFYGTDRPTNGHGGAK